MQADGGAFGQQGRGPVGRRGEAGGSLLNGVRAPAGYNPRWDEGVRGASGRGAPVRPGSYSSASRTTVRGRAGAAVSGVRQRRRPWWVLGLGMVGLVGWSGWVAAQPLPPTANTPALKAVQDQIQQKSASLSTLSVQAQQWQAQRQQLAQTLQQDDNMLAQLTGQRVNAGSGSTGSVNVPSMPVITRAS